MNIRATKEQISDIMMNMSSTNIWPELHEIRNILEALLELAEHKSLLELCNRDNYLDQL